MENNVCKILGDNIKKIRNAQKITQNDLAELIGLDVKSLSLIETGKGFASAKTIDKLSSVLKVSVQELFSVEDTTNNKVLYANIISNLDLIKNNAQKLNTVGIVVKSLI